MNDKLKKRFFFQLKYAYMHILEQDAVIDAIYKDIKVASIGGVRTESSMSIPLIKLAEEMANNKVYDTRIDEFAKCVSGVYDKLSKIISIVDEMKLYDERVQRTTSNTYHDAIDNILDKDMRAMIYSKIDADNYYLVYQRDKVVGGFTTNLDGYMSGFFSTIKGRGRELFKTRLYYAKKDKSAEATLRLFCTGNFLRDFYEKEGFRVKRVIQWMDKLAPEGWNYSRFGRPDLYVMEKVDV